MGLQSSHRPCPKLRVTSPCCLRSTFHISKRAKEEQTPTFIRQPQHQPHTRSAHLCHWLEGPPPQEEELILPLQAGLMLVSLLQGLTKTGANYKGVASSEDTSQQGTGRRPSGYSVESIKPTDGNSFTHSLGFELALEGKPPSPATSLQFLPPPLYCCCCQCL